MDGSSLKQIPLAGSVLVADDDPDARAILSDFLSDEGYRIAAVENGALALAHLDASPGPTVVLLDLMMPVMDGWTVLRHLAAQQRADVSVIVVTASGGFHPAPWGAGAVLEKPVDLEALRGMVASLMPGQSGARATVAESPRGAFQTSPDGTVATRGRSGRRQLRS